MPRIPRIKFPQRHPPKSSATPPTSDQHLFVPQSAKSQPKEPATKTGEGLSYRFRSDVPAPPSNTALGGKASLLPKRTPLSEEEIEAIMILINELRCKQLSRVQHIVMCKGWYAAAWVVDGCRHGHICVLKEYTK